MRLNKKFGDKIYIEWVDAYSDDDWQSVKKAINLSDEIYCYTNAYFIGQTKDYIIVSHTKGKTIENDIGGRLCIPKKWIRKVK